ncbi:uncharacterized protein [Miscanthus floridulus]|uniref:uncharacterized protein n=1 Tax=Miscanthus floridulus TaxID=154761 RepID=UPI003458EFF2
MEAAAPRTIEAATAGTGALATAEATMAEAGAPRTTDADVIVAGLPAQEVEMKAAEALAAPLVQGPPLLREGTWEVEVLPISSDDTSWAQEMVGAEVASVVDQPASTSGEGSSALAWELETRSLGKLVFLHRERDVWDQLHRQKGLLAGANELLSAWSAEVEDLRLRCADAKVEAAMAPEQLTPLAVRVKELEEELTCAASDWDAFRARAVEATALATALAGQLGAEQNAHQLTKGALDEALAAAEASRTKAVVWRGVAEELGSEVPRAVEASRVEAQRLKEKVEAFRVEARHWELKAKESEAEVTQAAEASSAVQMVLETEIREHEVLKSAARAACDALAVEGVQLGSSLGSRLTALSGQVHERLRAALHTGVKHALAVIASHYVGVDLQAISDGYVLPDDDDEADEVVTKLLEAAEGPSTALATLFEEEVVPPPPSADAGGAEP